MFMKRFLIVFIGTLNLASAQVIHHQMISSQGATIHLSNGMIVTQTIGQTSNIGGFNDYYTKGIQGFQQFVLFNNVDLPDSRVSKNLNAYPNPFKTFVNIDIPNRTIGSQYEYILYDITGKIIKRHRSTIESADITIDLEYLPNTTYILNVLYNGDNYSVKLIKQ